MIPSLQQEAMQHLGWAACYVSSTDPCSAIVHNKKTPHMLLLAAMHPP